jgi:hypothetical protein
MKVLYLKKQEKRAKKKPSGVDAPSTIYGNYFY